MKVAPATFEGGVTVKVGLIFANEDDAQKVLDVLPNKEEFVLVNVETFGIDGVPVAKTKV